MLRVPLEGLKAQSKTGRCSGFRWGAPSIVSLSRRYWRIASASSSGYPSLFKASGTVLLTILMTPPPTSHLYLTRSEEHTSELQSRLHLVCRLLLEKKKKK